MIAMGLSACDFSVGKKSAQRGVAGKHTAPHLKIAHRAAQGARNDKEGQTHGAPVLLLCAGSFLPAVHAEDEADQQSAASEDDGGDGEGDHRTHAGYLSA